MTAGMLFEMVYPFDLPGSRKEAKHLSLIRQFV